MALATARVVGLHVIAAKKLIRKFGEIGERREGKMKESEWKRR